MSISSPTKTKWMPLVWNEVWLENKAKNKMSKCEKNEVNLFFSVSYLKANSTNISLAILSMRMRRVEALRIRFKSIIIQPLALCIFFFRCLLCFFLLLLLFDCSFVQGFGNFQWHWTSKNIYCFDTTYIVCVVVCNVVSYLLTILWLRNIMKRLFALCNSIIFGFYIGRWLFGFHGYTWLWMYKGYIDSDMMPKKNVFFSFCSCTATLSPYLSVASKYSIKMRLFMLPQRPTFKNPKRSKLCMI